MSLPCWGCRTGQMLRSSRSTRTGWATTAPPPGRSCSSRSVLESGTAQETMDTIAHEAFHVQQAYVVENIDWDDAATQAAYYDQARRWLRNYQSGYVSGDEDILGYYFQPVEADARAYAKEETERLQELISRNLQEDK